MDYLNLGATGLRVSRICLGMMGFGNDSDRPWVIDEDGAEPIVKAAADGGVTFFDTADAYSIVGATRLGHLEDALAAEELELREEEMRRLEEPYVPHPVLGHG
jgi:aryl-alcohol dehydrogenase-like predicted oxidoreductase